jgi:DNA mismatch endonuclease (patch repair protein)
VNGAAENIMPDNLTPEQRHRSMSRVKNKDTDLERMVRSALHRRGLCFRKHPKDLPGSPDIVFSGAKVAVFVDGDFWHGYNFEELESHISPFWRRKISKNIQRDNKNLAELQGMGWTVIRVWQHEVKKDLESVVSKIIEAIK